MSAREAACNMEWRETAVETERVDRPPLPREASVHASLWGIVSSSVLIQARLPELRNHAPQPRTSSTSSNCNGSTGCQVSLPIRCGWDSYVLLHCCCRSAASTCATVATCAFAALSSYTLENTRSKKHRF